MIAFETTGHLLVIRADDDDAPVSAETIVDALAQSIDVDFEGVENEGAPVFVGNDYAEYQVTLTLPKVGGKSVRYGIGPAETKALNDTREALVRPYAEDGETLSLSRPRNGWVSIDVGDAVIDGISYVNPFLLEDLADWADDIGDRVHSTTVCLDCEGKGMAYLTAHEAQTVLALRDGDIAAEWEPHSMSWALDELADSIEADAGAWVHWRDDEDETPDQAEARIAKTIHRIRLAAERLRTDDERPDETLRLWLDLDPRELTREDGEALVAEMQASVARARALHLTNDNWYVNEERTFVESDDGKLVAVRVGVDACYFEDRQIAFLRTSDRLVEGAGWCDAKNSRVVRDALRRWCAATRRLHAA